MKDTTLAIPRWLKDEQDQFIRLRMTTITSTPKLTMKCKKLGINKDAIKESKNPVHVPSEKQVRRRTSFSKKILLTQER